MEEQREMERLESYRKQIIEEERQRLLREHASKLLGYLPKVSTLRVCLLGGDIKIINTTIVTLSPVKPQPWIHH